MTLISKTFLHRVRRLSTGVGDFPQGLETFHRLRRLSTGFGDHSIQGSENFHGFMAAWPSSSRGPPGVLRRELKFNSI